jgi:NAD+ synthase
MRTDEAQIGATYDELEWAMKQQEEGKENDKEKMNEKQKKVMDIYLQRHQANQHKMNEIPRCIIPKEFKQST